MIMLEINQILPTIAPRDAISNEAVEIRDILREWGYKSEIYAQNVHPSMKSIAHTHYKNPSKDNILIFHYSIGSEICDFVRTLPDKKIIRYHGITPEIYLEKINDYIAHLLLLGRKQLEYYPNITTLALANSEYTKRELVSIGFKNVKILPLILNFKKLELFNDSLLNLYSGDFVNILFVGRLIPQKRQDEVIKIFYYYKHINPKSRLFLVGSYEGFEKYYEELKLLIKELELNDVYITGSVPVEDLVSYYKLADIFICMSDWESFFAPLVECMFFNIPIMAYNATAIPDTLKDAGVLINTKNYIEIAEMINVIINDLELRTRIIEKQKEVLRMYNRTNAEQLLNIYIKAVID